MNHDTSRDQGITLHSSWWGISSGAISSLVLTGLGGWTVSAVGFEWVPTILLVLGLVLGAVFLLDLPISARISADGIERRPLLRRHHLDWESIRAISRGRPAVRAKSRSLNPGPLVAVVGRRRYMIIDQTESIEEYQRIIAVLNALGRHDDVELLLPPPDQRPPTWTYRRRRWQGR